MTPERVIMASGQEVFVDDCDYESVIKHRWWLTPSASTSKQRYATTILWTNGKRRTVRLHRMILGLTDPSVIVDHVNGNSLDNRRANLRLCNISQNNANAKRYCNNKIGLKGVSGDFRVPLPKPWRAQIRSNGKKIYLGSFASPEEAHAAYVAAAMKYHGEFANDGSGR